MLKAILVTFVLKRGGVGKTTPRLSQLLENRISTAPPPIFGSQTYQWCYMKQSQIKPKGSIHPYMVAEIIQLHPA
jgi:hypothetical protein